MQADFSGNIDVCESCIRLVKLYIMLTPLPLITGALI